MDVTDIQQGPARDADGGAATDDAATADEVDGETGGADAATEPVGHVAAAGQATIEKPSSERRRRERRRGERRRERWQLVKAIPLALGIGAGWVLAQSTLAVLARLRSILILIALSLFLSFAIEPAVQWLHNRGVRRGLGTGLVFLATAALATVFVLAVSGLVTDQVSSLVSNAPSLLQDLSDQADRLPESIGEPIKRSLEGQSEGLTDRLSSVSGEIGRRALGVGTTIVGGLFSLATVGLITFYLVADGPKLRRTLLRRVDPTRQREFVDLWELAIAKTGGYVYSRLVLAVLSAVVHIVAFTVLGLPYAAALGVWMGLVSSVVPVVGLYIAAAVPVVVALAEPEVSVLWIIVVVTVYQQLENYLVQPKITAETLELHPAVAFVAVLVGAALLGAVGALLALPAAAIVAALIAAYAEEHEVYTDATTPPLGQR